MKIKITDECINCIFNYDSISCKLKGFVEGYGETEDDGKPKHCTVDYIELTFCRPSGEGMKG